MTLSHTFLDRPRAPIGGQVLAGFPNPTTLLQLETLPAIGRSAGAPPPAAQLEASTPLIVYYAGERGPEHPLIEVAADVLTFCPRNRK